MSGAPTVPNSSSLKKRPMEVLLVFSYFVVGPPLQLYAHLTGTVILNYGSSGVKGFVIYCAISPLVAILLWMKSRRARFAVYVFLTMEVARSVRGGQFISIAMAAAMILALQTRGSRSIYPSMWERWGLKKT